MTMPDAVPRSRAVCTSMRTTDGPIACATSRPRASSRDSRVALLDRDEARAVGAADTQQVPVLLRRAQRGDGLLGRANRPAIQLDLRLRRLTLPQVVQGHLGADVLARHVVDDVAGAVDLLVVDLGDDVAGP